MRRRHVLAVGATLGLPRQSWAGLVWQLPTGYRANLFPAQNLERFASEVERSTAGGLRISVVPNNALARLADIPSAVSSGRVAAGEALLSGLAADVPVAGADAVPFIVRDYPDALRLWKFQRPDLQRAFASRGWRVLFAVPWPPQGLFSRHPVSRPADFRELRMRVYNPTTLRIAELLGARAVSVPMTDLPEALAQGRIDTMITSTLTGVDSEIWRSMGFYYDIRAWLPKNVVFAREAAWQSLSSEQQAAVSDAAVRSEPRGWALSEQAEKDSIAELRSKGMSVQSTPPLLSNDLRRMGERFSLEWLRGVGPVANEIFLPYFSER